MIELRHDRSTQRYLAARNHPIIGPSLRRRSDALAGKMVKSVGVVYSGALMRMVIALGSTAILARLLTPQDFGHVAMATVVTEMAALFSNFGVVSILVQRDRLTRSLLETAFWFSALLGLALGVLVFTSSGAVAAVYGDAVVGHVLRALAPMFLLDELTVVPTALLLRNMRFRQDIVIQNTMLIVRSTVAALLAWRGFGVDALIAGTLVGRVVTLALVWGYVPLLPRFRLRLPHVMHYFRRGSGYFAGGFLYYINSSVDRAIVGYQIGALAVGFYQGARNFSDQMRDRITAPLQRVLLPTYSALQGDVRALQANALKITSLLAFVLMPVGFGIAATSKELVAILYGPQWREMVPVLQYLAIAASVRGTVAVSTTVFQALDRIGLSVRVGMLNTLLLLAAILVGSHWGIVGVAKAALAASCVAAAIGGSVAFRLIGLSASGLGRCLAPAAFAAGGMLVAIHQLDTAILLQPPALASLGIKVSAGVAIYALAALILMRDRIDDVVRLVRRLASRDQRA